MNHLPSLSSLMNELLVARLCSAHLKFDLTQIYGTKTPKQKTIKHNKQVYMVVTTHHMER